MCIWSQKCAKEVNFLTGLLKRSSSRRKWPLESLNRYFNLWATVTAKILHTEISSLRTFCLKQSRTILIWRLLILDLVKLLRVHRYMVSLDWVQVQARMRSSWRRWPLEQGRPITSLLRYWQAIMALSAIFGLLGAYCISCCVATLLSMVMMTKKSLRWSKRANSILMAMNGVKSRKKQRTWLSIWFASPRKDILPQKLLSTSGSKSSWRAKKARSWTILNSRRLKRLQITPRWNKLL